MTTPEQLLERLMIRSSKMPPVERISFARTVIIPLLAFIADSTMHVNEDGTMASGLAVSNQIADKLDGIDVLLCRQMLALPRPDTHNAPRITEA